MALSLDEFRGGFVRGPRCSFGLILAELPASDREVVEAALEDPGVLGTRIAEVLQAEGYDVADHTVNRHRRGKCQC